MGVDAKYVVRAFLENDKQAVIDGFRKSTSGVERLIKTWDWHYNKNPLIVKRNRYSAAISKIKHLVLEKTEPTREVVGFVGLVPNIIKIDDKEEVGVWSVDMFVIPEHRSQSLRLVNALRKAFPFGLILGVQGAALAVETRMGWKQVDADETLVMRFPTKKIADRLVTKIMPKGLHKVVLLPTLFGLQVLSLVFKPPKVSNEYKIKEIKRFGKEADELWLKISCQYNVLVKRDAVYLNWKFADNLHSNFDMFTISYNGYIKGILILKIVEKDNLRWGQIIEMFTAPDDKLVIDSLISHSLLRFKRNQCDLVTVVGLSKEHRGALKRYGFLPFKYRPIFLVRPDGVYKDKQALLLDSKNWFISAGDSDGSI